MEGIIGLIILISIIQKIAEKLQEARQKKNPNQTTASPRQQEAFEEDELLASGQQTRQTSYDPLDPFRDWEEIFFPKEPKQESKPEIVYQQTPVKVAEPLVQPVAYAVNSDVQHSREEDHNMKLKSKQFKLSADKNVMRQAMLWTDILSPPKSQMHWRYYQRRNNRS